jgi:hypothetical protein
MLFGLRPNFGPWNFWVKKKWSLKIVIKLRQSGKVGWLSCCILKESKLLQRDDKVEDVNKNSFSTTLYLSYKKYSGLTFASEMKIGDKDNWQALTVVELKINTDISESDFKL